MTLRTLATGMATGMAVVFALLHAGGAEAKCRLHFANLPRLEFVGHYDAFANAGPATRFEVTIDTPTGGICDFAVGVDSGLDGWSAGG
ncbi:MAG TPA: hypothetical protein VK943_07135 [Arenibaculum sp.]|nr:hypothetical protein [Arenibaculum sp.]